MKRWKRGATGDGCPMVLFAGDEKALDFVDQVLVQVAEKANVRVIARICCQCRPN